MLGMSETFVFDHKRILMYTRETKNVRKSMFGFVIVDDKLKKMFWWMKGGFDDICDIEELWKSFREDVVCVAS